jgi:hypothetical protein
MIPAYDETVDCLVTDDERNQCLIRLQKLLGFRQTQRPGVRNLSVLRKVTAKHFMDLDKLLFGEDMRAQAATFERLVNEKVETIKTEAANKVAAAESAAAAKASEANKAVAQARALTEKFTSSSSGKTVVDFSIFRTQTIDGLVVKTGWKYQKADDPAPSSQWCYIEKTSVPDGLNLQIATDGSADPFNPAKAAKAGVTWSEVQRALPYCDWFKGANPNIREKGAGRS